MMKTDDVEVGDRVMFIHCDDPYTRLTYGVEGVVTNIDCMGTVFVKWDNGSSLGMVRSVGDRFLIIRRNRKK